MVSTSSREALDLFRAMPQRFDLVITDYLMPHMTGEILAQELRRIRPDIPIILCTGSDLDRDARKAKALSMDALVMKPWDIADFARTVEQVLEQRPGRRR